MISVILPVYNVEKYIEACLDSLLNQSYENFEVIAVNDGSTDKSLQLLKLYKSRFKKFKIINQENKGLSGARNTGLQYAKGKYIYFLDSDDLILNNTFEKLISQAEDNNADLIRFCAQSFVDDGFDYKIAADTYSDNGILVPNRIYSKNDFLMKNRQKGVFKAPVWLYFVKADVILKNKLSFKEGLIHEDELFTPLLFLHCERILYDPTPYFQRRYRPSSIMTSDIHNSIESYNSKLAIIKLLENNKMYMTLKGESLLFINWRIKSLYTTLFPYSFFNIKKLKSEVVEITKNKQQMLYIKYKLKKRIKRLYRREV